MHTLVCEYTYTRVCVWWWGGHMHALVCDHTYIPVRVYGRARARLYVTIRADVRMYTRA